MISPDGMCHVVNPRCSTDSFPIALKAEKWAEIREKVAILGKPRCSHQRFLIFFRTERARMSLQSEKKTIKKH